MKWLMLSVVFAVAGCRTNAPETGPTLGPGMVASFDGVPIAYAVEGVGRPVLVFVHGWSCDRSYWAEQVPAFAGKYGMVAIDLAGHGESGSDRAVWDVDSLARDVAAVVEQLDLEEVILVGHSLGGPTALAAAALLPGRVVGVVGVDTLHDAGLVIDPVQWGELIARFEADFAGSCRVFLDGMMPGDADVELVESIAADMSSAPPRIAIPLLESYGRFDRGAALAAAGVPVRCINSDIYPTNLAGNRAFAPDFEVVTMEGVGHFPMMERPAAFNRLLAEAVAALSAR